MFKEHENYLSRQKKIVLNENSVEGKPCIDGESKSDEITIYLYSCHDINVKFLAVVTPPSIYQTTHTKPLKVKLDRINIPEKNNIMHRNMILHSDIFFLKKYHFQLP